MSRRAQAAGGGPWLAAMASFVLGIQDTGVIVALPRIGASLGIPPSGLDWVVIAYVLAIAVVLLPAGVAIDRHGPVRVLAWAVAAFGIGSVIAGLSSNQVEILTGRILQGVGVGGIGPASMALAAQGGGRAPARAIAVWTGAASAGLAAGPVIAGITVDGVGWRWIFLANGPLAIAGVLFAVRLRGDRLSGSRASSVRVGSLLLAGASTGALMLLLAQGPRSGWLSFPAVAATLSAVVALIALVRVERSSSRPLVPPGELRSRAFLAACAVAFVSTAAMCSVLFFVSAHLQVDLGNSPAKAGVILLPLTIAIAIMAPLAAAAAERFQARDVVSASIGILAVGLVVLATFGFSKSMTPLLVALAIVGIGVGLANAVAMIDALTAARPALKGTASALLNASQMIGLAIGIMAIGAVSSAGTVLGQFTRSRFVHERPDQALPEGFLAAALVVLATAALARLTFPRQQNVSDPGDGA